MPDKPTKPQQRRNAILVEAGKATRFKPGQSGNPGGRPATPKLLDLIRQEVEERADEILAALFEALKAERSYGAGESIITQTDHAMRVKAAVELLDRVYGKPTQRTELAGDAGGPIRIQPLEAISDPELIRDATKLRTRLSQLQAPATPDEAA